MSRLGTRQDFIRVHIQTINIKRENQKIKKTKSVLKWAKSGWTRISKYQIFKILLSKVLFNGHGDENHVSRCCCSWQLVRLSVTYASWIFLKKQLFLLIGLNVTELGRQYNKFYHMIMIGFVLNNIDIIFDITKIFGFFIAHWD